MGFFDRFNDLSSNILLTFGCYFDNPQCPGVGAFERKLSAQFKCPAYARPPHQRLNIDRCIRPVGLHFRPQCLRFRPVGLCFRPQGLRFRPVGLRSSVFVFDTSVHRKLHTEDLRRNIRTFQYGPNICSKEMHQFTQLYAKIITFCRKDVQNMRIFEPFFSS